MGNTVLLTREKEKSLSVSSKRAGGIKNPILKLRMLGYGLLLTVCLGLLILDFFWLTLVIFLGGNLGFVYSYWKLFTKEMNFDVSEAFDKDQVKLEKDLFHRSQRVS